MLSTHAAQLERWLGRDQVEHISEAMRDWYGPPIALANVPGRVYACGGGDFVGRIHAGRFVSSLDYAWERGRLHLRQRFREWVREQRRTLNAPPASLSELIARLVSGGGRDFTFQKVGTTGVVGATNSLWRVGNQPAAGANAANAPGGESPTDTTTGAFTFDNPSISDEQWFVNGWATAGAVNTLFLYDRIFQVNKTMSSTTAETVTGTPSRYQSSTPGNNEYSGGNFLFIECGAALGATAHNWTTCTYTDQDGNTGATLPSVTGNSSCIVNRLDQPTGQWFCPLATGDTGIKALTQMQCSASVTGTINFVIGHPIALIGCPVVNIGLISDGINTALNLNAIIDDAALAFLEITKPATTAATYTGQFKTVR